MPTSALMRNHDSDEDEDQMQGQDMTQDQEVTEDESDIESSDDAPLSDLLRSNYFYGKINRKWAKTPPSLRVHGTGCEIFRCAMYETRFLILLLCLRFDNPDDRNERIKTDKLAAECWLNFQQVINSQ
ncbi:unnamed protein product [Parnassius apollo]|uniref:(apollo) hypothetical protein n=1 Tax=Parnassius apollo TaxID=110799 RepID=A0A8S3WI26_PARAO|nr:unnamed protein product [Parnassius apollo]